MPEVSQGVLDVCPSCDHRTENHEAEGEKRNAGHGAAKPENLAVGNQNDGEIFEDGVDRDREELESFGAGVNHDDESEGYGKP